MDDVLVTNVADPPSILVESFDPIDPSNWLFFPGGKIQVSETVRKAKLYIRASETMGRDPQVGPGILPRGFTRMLFAKALLLS